MAYNTLDLTPIPKTLLNVWLQDLTQIQKGKKIEEEIIKCVFLSQYMLGQQYIRWRTLTAGNPGPSYTQWI